MPSPAYRFLEYVFLALLYLFFVRVVRAVWVELREPKLVALPPQAAEDTVSSSTLGGAGHPRQATGPPVAPAGRRRGHPGKLVVMGNGPLSGTSFPLSEEMTIGRAAGCAVPLPDDTFVSQLHARVFVKGDDYWVEDLGSTNGTLLNGRKVTGPVPIRRGDRVQVGQSILELQK